MRSKAFVAKRAKLDQLVRDKDEYMTQFRGQARVLTSELEGYLAKKRMQARIDSLNPAERKALLAGLQAEEG